MLPRYLQRPHRIIAPPSRQYTLNFISIHPLPQESRASIPSFFLGYVLQEHRQFITPSSITSHNHQSLLPKVETPCLWSFMQDKVKKSAQLYARQ